MEQLSIIEQIAFERLGTVAIADLPLALRKEIDLFNKWTTETAKLQDDLKVTHDRITKLKYARDAAFALIQTQAQEIDRQHEAPSPINAKAAVSDTTIDAEQSTGDLVD